MNGAIDGVVEELLAATGRWPILLALVNGAVRDDLNAGRQAEESMREILRELRTTGPTALDVIDAHERRTSVARTIEIGLSRLDPELRARYLELAVFGEDVAIPGPVLARYWKTTGGLSEGRTQRYCQRLVKLARTDPSASRGIASGSSEGPPRPRVRRGWNKCLVAASCRADLYVGMATHPPLGGGVEAGTASMPAPPRLAGRQTRARRARGTGS